MLWSWILIYLKKINFILFDKIDRKCVVVLCLLFSSYFITHSSLVANYSSIRIPFGREKEKEKNNCENIKQLHNIRWYFDMISRNELKQQNVSKKVPATWHAVIILQLYKCRWNSFYFIFISTVSCLFASVRKLCRTAQTQFKGKMSYMNDFCTQTDFIHILHNLELNQFFATFDLIIINYSRVYITKETKNEKKN